MHILVTGITGSVGVELLRLLAAREPGVRLTCLIRASSPEELERRWRSALSTAGVRSESGCRAVAGDVTQPGLGLGADETARLNAEITHVIHGAADVRFAGPLAESRLINVDGTRNMLAAAAGFRRLEAFAHVSSVYVAGRRTGRILEDELEHEAGFVTTYEETKYEAELVAREFMKQLPVAIYRLTLLPGRTADGYVHQFGAFHQVLYYYQRGLLRMLPGAPVSRIDMAPTDWAAGVMLKLFLRHFEAGRTYHVCSGRTSVTMTDFIALSSQYFARDPMGLVDAPTYRESLRSAGTRIARVMDTTVPHTQFAKQFDSQRVRERLGTEAEAPVFEEYYPRIVQYCVESGWGRRRPISAINGAAATR